MGVRQVTFREDEICEVCGKKGAFDFMGDSLCTDCAFDSIAIKPKKPTEEDIEWAKEKITKYENDKPCKS